MAKAFVLHGSAAPTAIVVVGFAQDVNGNAVFEPATDIAIANDAATPALAPGATMALLALVRGDAATATGALTIALRAVTGSGTPGTPFIGQGEGGSDAVVGASHAAAAITLPFVATQASADASLVKTQSVRAPDGSDAAVQGATITYSIEARFPGGDAARDARLADPVPEGTDYVPASLRLDGDVLSDAADGDAGAVQGGAVAVLLGDVTAPAVRTVSFQVKIK